MKIALNPLSLKFFHVNTMETTTNGAINKTVTLQPFQVTAIPLSAHVTDGSALISIDPEVMSALKIFVPDSMGKVLNATCHVLVKNCSPMDVTLQKGTKICSVENICQEVISVNRSELQNQLTKGDNTPLPPPITQERRTSLLKQLNFTVPEKEKQAYLDLFLRNYDVFSTSKHDLGSANNFEHTIKLKTPDPIYRKQFRIPDAHRAALNQQIDEWLKIGIIEPCFSRFNSPIFIVPKKDGTFRFVLDYRALNANSLEDRYTMKDVGECIGEIGRAGSTIFSLMDLTSGFWQMPLQASSRHCTAFTCPGKGQFQYNVVSMGLKGGPGSFQRMMELAMSGIQEVIVYIDDLLLHTKDHATHRQGLQKVFNRLRNVNIKLNPEKCNFGATTVNYLGFRLTPEGILPGTDKLKAVRDMPPPSSVTQVRQFLGLCNYFRTHVRNFASLRDASESPHEQKDWVVWGQPPTRR